MRASPFIFSNFDSVGPCHEVLKLKILKLSSNIDGKLAFKAMSRSADDCVGAEAE